MRQEYFVSPQYVEDGVLNVPLLPQSLILTRSYRTPAVHKMPLCTIFRKLSCP